MLEKIRANKSYAPVAGASRKDASKGGAPVGLIAAATLCIVLCFFELFFVFFQVVIDDGDRFNNDSRTAWTTMVAVVATFVAFFITSQVRDGWMRWIDYKLATEGRASYRNLDTAWRAHLGFLGIKERITRLRTWPIQLLYVFTGLLAAGLIASTTPTDGSVTTPYSPWIPQGADCSCAGTLSKKPGDNDPAGWATGEATWSLSDTASYAASNRTDSSRCALSQMPGLLNLINNEAPQQMAYSVDGIAVQGSALGAPELLFSTFYNTNLSTAYRDAVAAHGRNLLSLTQCAPVLKHNPFKCRADPSGSTKVDMVGSSNFGTFSVTSGGCSYSKWYNGDLDNGTSSQLMSGAFCAGQSVGQGTMVVGGVANAAVNLALMVGDMAWAEANWQQQQTGYTVRCDVDVAAAIGWRQVTLSLGGRGRVDGDADTDADTPPGQVVSGGDDCTPPSGGGALGPAYAATAAGVAGKVLADENEDIYFPKTLIAKALSKTGDHPAMFRAQPIQPLAAMVRGPPWAFADGSSANGLEDVLGVAAGMVMSRMIAQNFTGNEDVGTVVKSSGNAQSFSSSSGDAPLPTLGLGSASYATAVVRVGPGRLYGVVFAVPALLVAAVCSFLAARLPWHREALRSSALLDIMAMNRGGEVCASPAGPVVLNAGAPPPADPLEGDGDDDYDGEVGNQRVKNINMPPEYSTPNTQSNISPDYSTATARYRVGSDNGIVRDRGVSTAYKAADSADEDGEEADAGSGEAAERMSRPGRVDMGKLLASAPFL